MYALEWSEYAACQGAAFEDGYSTPQRFWRQVSSGQVDQVRESLQDLGPACSTCPVARQCARMPLDLGDSGLVYAGIPVPNFPNRWASRYGWILEGIADQRTTVDEARAIVIGLAVEAAR